MDSFNLLFSAPKELEFLNIKFDFDISPDHFIKWLELEGEEIEGDYKFDVGAMCEYSCLFIAMMLHDKELEGEMKIYYGKFGFFEHYWVGYTFRGEEYFIDLTLMQFVDDAPKLSITKAENKRVSGGYSYIDDGDVAYETIHDYIKRQRAFMFYTNPKTMKKPDTISFKPYNIDL